MRRTLVQFDEDTHRELRRQAFSQHRSMASLVRELVVRGLDHRAGRPRAARAARFASVGAGRSRQSGAAPVSEHHDEALAAAFDE
jgi:plasmid stability protein